jgi:hypothetical protein
MAGRHAVGHQIQEKDMIMKSLIAASAIGAAIAVAAPAQQAEAKVNVYVGIGGGYGPGFYPGYGYGYEPHPVYHPHWGISCGKGRNIVRWSGFHKVQPIDCSAPVYQYRAWKNGAPWRVKVSAKGHIINAKPLYYH